MLNIPVLRWGKEYTSLEVEPVVHFSTGEEIASVSQANGGIIQRDMRKVSHARDILREIPIKELIAMVGKAGDLHSSSISLLSLHLIPPAPIIPCAHWH